MERKTTANILAVSCKVEYGKIKLNFLVTFWIKVDDYRVVVRVVMTNLPPWLCLCWKGKSRKIRIDGGRRTRIWTVHHGGIQEGEVSEHLYSYFDLC